METEAIGALTMPGIGFGTLGRDGDPGSAMVEAALAEGYRHLDTARRYGNEEAVGVGLDRSAVARGDVWLTTKLLHPKSPPMPDLAGELEESLRRLRTEYVDLLLLHWPRPDLSLEWVLGEFVKFRDAGKVRAIGVSNFPSALLEEALTLVDDLATNQVEYHPFLDQDRLLAVMRAHGLVLTAHSPLARGTAFDDPVLQEIAADRGITVVQVVLRWLVQQDRVVAVPGAETIEQLRQNLAVLTMRLTEDEMSTIADLRCGRRTIDPPHGPQWDPA